MTVLGKEKKKAVKKTKRKTETAQHCCAAMTMHLSDGDVAIDYFPRFREYSIRLRDRRRVAVQQIDFCPWCGVRLPDSLRDVWFDTLEAMGLKPELWGGDEIPSEFQDDTWWRFQEDHVKPGRSDIKPRQGRLG